MTLLPDQSHYEVLELHRGAAPDEIERAYRAARESFRPESLALYSIFGDREASSIRERIDEAYRVLSDAESRRAYDLATGGGEKVVSALLGGASASRVVVGSASAGDAAGADGESAELVGASDAFRLLESDVEEESGEFDGAKLRRARLRRGFELEHIAEVTKIGVAHLERIEEEEFAALPANVYVRGYVTAYVRTIGLDPQRVVPSYMGRVELARSQPRGRFRGRARAGAGDERSG